MKPRRVLLIATAVGSLVALALAGAWWPTSRPVATPPQPADVAQRPPAHPIPWQSIRWTRLETNGVEFERPGQYLTKVTSGPSGGLVAIGVGPNPRAPQGPDQFDTNLTVWTSPDGRAWRATPVIAGVAADSVGEGSDVAASRAGIVIVGAVCCRVEGPAIWWSPDGVTWERETVQAPAGTLVASVAAGPAGFVATGGNDGQIGMAWTSPDGRTWTPIDPDQAGFVRGRLNDAAPVGDGFVLAGYADPGNADSDAAIWRSDGIDGWRRVAADDPALNGDDEAAFDTIVPFAEGLFAVGSSGSRQDRLQCEQLLGGAPVAGLGDIALSCGWSREMNWRSDGERWERVDPWGPDGEYPPDFVGPPPGRAPIDWAHVAAGGPGLVALQYELVGPGDDSGDDLGLWVSADGASWTRVGDGPIIASETLVGVLVDGRRVFVLTEAGHAWVGTAGP